MGNLFRKVKGLTGKETLDPYFYYSVTNWTGLSVKETFMLPYVEDESLEEENDSYNKIIQSFFELLANRLEKREKLGFLYCKEQQHLIYNIASAFDIETSSFKDDYETKYACMYIWQFGIDGVIILGRTWSAWLYFLSKLVDFLGLNKKTRLRIYVHNLAYEFQWIKKFFEWEKVFALKKRKVVRALTEGIEFRCSYILSNASLAHVGEKMLTKYKVKKAVGDLDYSLVRHPKTFITDTELGYCIGDVKVVMAYIQEQIEINMGISNIPLTNTGFVREDMQEICISDKEDGIKFHAVMSSLTIDSPEEYEQNKRCLAGGMTRTAIYHANQTLWDMGSADETSKYPAEMVANYYPMSKAEYIGEVNSAEEFKYYLERYCCIFDIEFNDLEPDFEYENYISLSHCMEIEEPVVNNGRVVSAKRLVTTLCEIDFEIVSNWYTWRSMRVSNLRIYARGFLPKPIVESVLTYYARKTELKDVEGEEVEYMRKKNNANSTFGMMLTDIIRPEYLLDENFEWYSEDPDVESQLKHYNKNFNRFLFYTWGIYVTAHARYSLYEAINEFKEDYVYCDTDSIKGLNFDKHLDWFEYQNYLVEKRNREASRVLGIDFKLFCPKNIYGEEKMIGVWEIEKPYKRFRAAGAKRYLYTRLDKDGKEELGMTVAGLNKKFAIPYLLESHNNNLDAIFEDFKDGFWIPAGHTGKQTLTYIDKETEGWVTDYNGDSFYFHEDSSIHMEPQHFVMSQTEDYLNLMKGVQMNELR